MNDLLSIILPIYNVEKYLPLCLDSILSQTYSNFECILVDDGSTDDSGKICDDYVLQDNRFKVIHKINEGVSVARNTGIDLSTGKYIGFIDPDDFISDIYYEILINAHKQFPDYIIQSNKVCFTNKQIPISKSNKNVRLGELNKIAGAVFRVLYESSILKENNIRMTKGLSFYEDALFNIEYAQKSNKKEYNKDKREYYAENPDYRKYKRKYAEDYRKREPVKSKARKYRKALKER